MRVFISWSGDKSKAIAEALRGWLPMVVQAVEPYMSDHDNQAGVRWNDLVGKQLDGTSFGILCMTPTNLEARWLLFEAGALSKSMDDARVVPLLYELTPSQLTPPLTQFQMKTLDRLGMRDVVTSINSGLDTPLQTDTLNGIFDAMWPRLESELGRIRDEPSATPPVRPDRELIEEVLSIVRGLSSQAAGQVERSVSEWSGYVSASANPASVFDEVAHRMGEIAPEIALRRHGNVVEVMIPVSLSMRKQSDARAALRILEAMGYAVRMVELHPSEERNDPTLARDVRARLARERFDSERYEGKRPTTEAGSELPG